jgi:hypothetical protein
MKKSTAKSKKKKSVHRNKEKNVTFNLKRMVANRREQLAVDYLNQLSEKEKNWLNRFNEEYVLANFNHPGKVLDDSPKAKKRSYDANNARNRCLYTMSKVTGKLNKIMSKEHLEILLDHDRSNQNPEDALIEAIDAKLDYTKLLEELNQSKKGSKDSD